MVDYSAIIFLFCTSYSGVLCVRGPLISTQQTSPGFVGLWLTIPWFVGFLLCLCEDRDIYICALLNSCCLCMCRLLDRLIIIA